MRERLLWLLNGALLFGTIIILLLHFANTSDANTLPQNIILPGSSPA